MLGILMTVFFCMSLYSLYFYTVKIPRAGDKNSAQTSTPQIDTSSQKTQQGRPSEPKRGRSPTRQGDQPTLVGDAALSESESDAQATKTTSSSSLRPSSLEHVPELDSKYVKPERKEKKRVSISLPAPQNTATDRDQLQTAEASEESGEAVDQTETAESKERLSCCETVKEVGKKNTPPEWVHVNMWLNLLKTLPSDV